MKRADITISPILYMGNKRKLVRKGLCAFFPDRISQYYEPFAGSAIVAMNTKAGEWHINDLYEPLSELYDMFATKTPREIVGFVESKIEEYGLPKECTRRFDFKDKAKLNQYKEAYYDFRDAFNNCEGTDKPLYLYTLMLFAFSQQMRFNNNGKFNMPMGNNCFSGEHKKFVRNGCAFFGKTDRVHCTQIDFRNFFDTILMKSDEDTFVYIDPPYLNTTAIYNEGSKLKAVPAWDENCELDLYECCERLRDRGIKFAMSNVFANKGKTSDLLIEWCRQQGYNVHHFNGHTYSACGHGNSQTDEVLIMNY